MNRNNKVKIRVSRTCQLTTQNTNDNHVVSIHLHTDIDLHNNYSDHIRKDENSDKVYVSDIRGHRLYLTSEIALALGITDRRKMDEMEHSLKEFKYKDTKKNVYSVGVDYIELTGNESNLISKEIGSLNYPSMYVDNLEEEKTITIWSRDAAKRIGVSANTERGDSFARTVDMDFLESQEMENS